MHGLGHRINCPQALQEVTHRKSRGVELPDRVNLILKQHWIPHTQAAGMTGRTPALGLYRPGLGDPSTPQ